MIVEVDPDSSTAILNLNDQLENIAIGSGDSGIGSVSSLSDDPNNVADVDSDADGHPNDPTTLAIGDLQVIKTAGIPSVTFAGASVTPGNFVVPYTITSTIRGMT